MNIDLRAPPPGWRFDDVEVRADERRVLRGGIAQPLGSRAFDLLRLLIERRGQVVTKDELMPWVWPGLVVEENNLTVQISALRKAIGAKAIRTVPGRGYQLAVDAVAIGPMEPSAVESWPATCRRRPRACLAATRNWRLCSRGSPMHAWSRSRAWAASARRGSACRRRLPSARRHSARHRAGRSPRSCNEPGADSRPARPALPAAHRRHARCAGSAPDPAPRRVVVVRPVARSGPPSPSGS